MKLDMPPFQQARVLVVGDLMLDRYWHGKATRISPEAPVPVVRVANSEDRPGGAGNVALNIAALGAAAGRNSASSAVKRRDCIKKGWDRRPLPSLRLRNCP